MKIWEEWKEELLKEQKEHRKTVDALDLSRIDSDRKDDRIRELQKIVDEVREENRRIKERAEAREEKLKRRISKAFTEMSTMVLEEDSLEDIACKGV